VAIYDDVQALDYAGANQASALLLLFAVAMLTVTYALQRRPVQL
jgi:ABC-type molybdate transport system permease subunit